MTFESQLAFRHLKHGGGQLETTPDKQAGRAKFAQFKALLGNT